MAETDRGAPFWIGIAFVLGVVAFAWMTAERREAEAPVDTAEAVKLLQAAAALPDGGAPSLPPSPATVKAAHEATRPVDESASLAVTRSNSGGAGGRTEHPESGNGPGPGGSDADTRVPTQEPEVHASIEKDDVRSVIKQLAPQFHDCYEQGLSHDPKLGSGKVTVEFTLKRDVTMGSIPAEGSIADSTLGAPLVEACILDKLRSAKFPEMKGEGTVKVRYPFVFNTGADAGAL